MDAKIYKLDLFGKTIWRLMATHNGAVVAGLGHMIDLDDHVEAQEIAISVARRNGWGYVVSTYYEPGKVGSTRSAPAA